MQIGTSGPWGNNMRRSTLGDRRSKIEVTEGQRLILESDGSIILDPLALG